MLVADLETGENGRAGIDLELAIAAFSLFLSHNSIPRSFQRFQTLYSWLALRS